MVHSQRVTRLHSSRMRAARALTVSPSMLCGGEGVCSGEGCLLPGRRGVVSQHALRQTPPVNRITHTSKNITLATTSLRAVKTTSQNFNA